MVGKPQIWRKLNETSQNGRKFAAQSAIIHTLLMLHPYRKVIGAPTWRVAMSKIVFSLFLALFAMTLPAFALDDGPTALDIAVFNDACAGQKPVSAIYVSGGEVEVICPKQRTGLRRKPTLKPTVEATNFVPLLGGLGPLLGVGAAGAAIAAAASGGSSTSDTQ